jgi:DNA-binding beta-propeller fold protein YncE
MVLALAWLALRTAQAQTTNYALGTTSLLVGPTTGTNSVVLAVTPQTAAWTNTANADWLQLSLANQTGDGSTNVNFSYDANPGATRTGTLTIAGQTLTVTQAGSTYVAANPMVTTLVSSGLSDPRGVAVDGAGNVYIADTSNNTVKKWTVASSTVTNLVAVGLSGPSGVAVDSAGNVYIADTRNNAIKKWRVANSNVTTLVASGLNQPWGVAVDGMGNVYIADPDNNAIYKWSAANSNLTTLVSSGLNNPQGVAVDVAGNVYITSYIDFSNVIKEWTAANSNLTTLALGPGIPQGVAVDGAGNIYIADDNNVIKKWTAANNNLTTLVSSGLNSPQGVAVDTAGNVYITSYIDFSNAIKELPYAFVDPTPKLEGLTAGSDALPVVLPATENLRAPFAPTSDQSWLTITGITNDVVSFSFTANTGLSRTVHITLLGQTIPVTQAGVTPPILTDAQMLDNGVLQFAFSNTVGASFTVLSSTDLSVPMSNWMVVGTASNTAPGQFQFTSQPTTNDAQCFYGVRSP